MSATDRSPGSVLSLDYAAVVRWLLVCALLPFLCTVCPAGDYDAVEQGEAVTLGPGQTLERRMSNDESHSFKVALARSQYFGVLIEQYGIDVSVTLSDPAGKVIAEADSPAGAYGPEYLFAVSGQEGDYTLRLTSVTGRTVSGRYVLTVEELRETRTGDEDRVAAARASAEGRKKPPEEALKEYEKALSYWKDAGDSHWQAVTLYSISAVYRTSGNSEKALEYLQRTLGFAPQLDARDWRLVASAWNDSGFMLANLGRHEEAVEALKKALALYKEKQDVRGQGSALINLGYAHAKAGKFEEARAYTEEALEYRRAERDKASEANILNSIGGYLSALGQPDAALNYYTQALPILRAAASPIFERIATGHQPDGREKEVIRRLAAVTNNIALHYDYVGEWQLALENYEEALKLFRSVGDKGSEAATLNNVGTLYFALGSPRKALEHLEQSLKLTREVVKDPNALAERLINVAKVHVAEGSPDAALAAALEALGLKTNDRMRAATFASLGAVRSLQDNPSAAIESFSEALKLQKGAGDKREEAAALLKRGEARVALKEYAAALSDINAALALSKAVGDPLAEAEALRAIALVEFDRHNLTEALARGEEALGIVERLRTKVASQQLRISYFATIQQYFETDIDISMRLYRETGRAEYAATALQASERARARALVDTLLEDGSGLRQGVSPQLIGTERELHRRLNAKARTQTELLSGKHTPEQATAIAKELDELIAEYDRVEAEIRRASPKYAALTQPPAPTLRDIQERLLDDNSLLLEFELGEEKSYLWAVDKTTITGYELPKRPEIEGATQQLYSLLTAQQPVPNEDPAARRRRVEEASARYPSQAVALSRTLLAPAAARLTRKRLLVVADGQLHYLPFSALPVPADGRAAGAKADRGGTKLLIEDYEVVSLPSVTSVLLMHDEALKRKSALLSVVVFADPVLNATDSRLKEAKGTRPSAPPAATNVPPPDEAVLRDGFELNSLPRTLDEAKAIEAAAPATSSSLMLGFKANRAAVANLPPAKYRIVHFATHALLDETHPELSGIVLSLFDEKGNSEDGMLRLHDIYNLRLPADLVVLSACSTGRGSLVRGEGIIGLTRGFMYAGSPRVVASLWKVDDLATQQLMERFYTLLFKQGMSPAAALRQAQLGMLREKRWQAPFNWAAFTLYGEWRQMR
jgi:CHAT domain-containing protein